MCRLSFIFATLLLLLSLCPVHARPAHKQAAAQYFGRFLPKKFNDCVLCHLPAQADGDPDADGDTDKPHNAFGSRLKLVKRELQKAGKQTTIEARLDAVLPEDSDGDGAANVAEILTGHSPADKTDHPVQGDDSKHLLVDFARFRGGYPWRPFEVVKSPAVPQVKNARWVHNPVDAFIALEHESLGLKPRPQAPREVLLRRVYLDLIGLPPTPDELHAYLGDAAPDAYEKVVDRLLSSPQYGERWGRHWMDIWRYSDWAGFGAQIRDSQPHIWRWRDWIIEALNEDKPYDRMILEMIAGDELAPEDPQALIATGYLVRNWKLLSREKWLQDTVEHTFMAFQGITLGCAKCHDHMFDPILQTDYYRVRALFEPHHVRIDRIPGKPDTKVDGIARVYDKDLAAATYLFLRGDERTPDKSKPLPPAVPGALGQGLNINPVALPRSAAVPERRKFVVEETLQASTDQIAQAEEQLKKAKADESAVAELEVSFAKAKHDALIAVLKVEDLEEQGVGSSRVDLQACKLEYSIVSPK